MNKVSFQLVLAIFIVAGICCFNSPSAYGEEHPVNKEHSFEAVMAQAEEGDAEAQYKLGEMYRFGDEVEQDIEEGIRWFRMAAEQGHAEAQFDLGWIFQNKKMLSMVRVRQSNGSEWLLGRDIKRLNLTSAGCMSRVKGLCRTM